MKSWMGVSIITSFAIEAKQSFLFVPFILCMHAIAGPIWVSCMQSFISRPVNLMYFYPFTNYYFFYRSKLSTGNCAIFLHCLKTRFLDFIRWSCILRGFKFLGYQSRWRRMDPNFQCMSIWPEKKIGNKIKIDGRNQGFIMRKSNSTLTFLAVSAFLISPRLCSLWETQTAFSLANYLKDSLMSFLPACILHSST